MIEVHPNPERRWQNRRRMAWICVWAAVLFPLLVLGTDSDQLAGIAGPFYLFVGTVVGLYIGATTYEDTKIGGKE